MKVITDGRVARRYTPIRKIEDEVVRRRISQAVYQGRVDGARLPDGRLAVERNSMESYIKRTSGMKKRGPRSKPTRIEVHSMEGSTLGEVKSHLLKLRNKIDNLLQEVENG